MPILALAAGALILLLILFLLASPSFRLAIQNTISGIPVIGGWLAENNERLIVFLYGKLAEWASSGVGALTQLLNTLADLEYGFANQLQNLASAVHETVLHLRQNVIPAAVRQAESYTDARVSAAYNALAAAVGAVRTRGEQLYAAAVSRADTEYAQAILYAQRIGLWGAEFGGRIWVSAIAYSQQLFAHASLDAQAREARAENYTARSQQAVSQYAQDLFATAVARADAEVRIAEQFAAKLAGENVRYTDLSNAQTVAWTGAVVGTVAAAVTAIENSPCMQRCGTLGDLGSELEALDLAALLGLLLAASQDPQRFAAELRAELEPVIGAGREILSGLGGPAAA